MIFALNLRNPRPRPWWPGWTRVGFHNCRGRYACQVDVSPTGEVAGITYCRAHQPPRTPVPVPVTPATDAEVAEFVAMLPEARRNMRDAEIEEERARRRG